MPVEQRRVTVDRSLAASEQENTPLKGMPRSGIRYVEPRTNAPSHTGSRPAQPRNTQRARTTASQPARRTGDARLRLPADVQYAENDYAVQTERLPVLERRTGQSTRPRTTQAVPTSTSMHRQMSQEPITRPAAPRLTQVGMILSSLRHKSRRMWQWQHPLTRLGIVLCTCFLALEIGLNSATWFISTWSDPLTYFHRDSAIVTINGHREQVRAFMSEGGQVDLLVVPQDASKSKVLAGAQTSGMDPDRVMFQVTSHGSQIEVEAIAPREMVAHLYAEQDTLPCVFDLAQKGGK